MGCEVYANGDEIACKAGDGKVIASFPDVCLSPPSPPAGPIPLPYPDTSFSKDMQDGSKTVTIKGKEVMLKNQSYYKTSPLGDEAATRGLGANVITHVITGKTYFAAWSMDVKIEGQNVDRHCDLTTSNHASYPAGCVVPNPNLSMVALAFERIEQDLCPCCGQDITICPAAFQKGEGAQLRKDGKLLGFAEYYNLLPWEDPLTTRQQEAEILMETKDNCTCPPGNEVFPSPPCDVHRADPDPARTKRIENKWNENKVSYVKTPPLKTEANFINEILAENPAMAAIHAKLSKLRKGDKELAEYRKQVSVPAAKKARINHRTPKEAGGCPGHPPAEEGNLQPQQTLCKGCQSIDDWMTDHWQG